MSVSVPDPTETTQPDPATAARAAATVASSACRWPSGGPTVTHPGPPSSMETSARRSRPATVIGVAAASTVTGPPLASADTAPGSPASAPSPSMTWPMPSGSSAPPPSAAAASSARTAARSSRTGPAGLTRPPGKQERSRTPASAGVDSVSGARVLAGADVFLAAGVFSGAGLLAGTDVFPAAGVFSGPGVHEGAASGAGAGSPAGSLGAVVEGPVLRVPLGVHRAGRLVRVVGARRDPHGPGHRVGGTAERAGRQPGQHRSAQRGR